MLLGQLRRGAVFTSCHLQVKSCVKMERRRLQTYNEAIAALNGLQTNAVVLEKVKEERLKNYANQNLTQTRKFLVESGLSLADLRGLNVIHVSGTKGKGSTCAFTESILRQHGLKTGFYSSPHLVSVTERIRINGVPISQDLFASHFWPTYDKICRNPDDRPAYFKFLTILALNVFIKEKVDVAVIEVGIGGAYDCTNITENPVAVGITTLDYDHVKVLGESIEEIAWHKAGIMKAGSVAFVNPNQPRSALEVLAKRSKELNCPIFGAPKMDKYDWSVFPPEGMSLFKQVHENNASIALQLARFFLSRTYPDRVDPGVLRMAKGFQLSLAEALGLRLCSWPGRSHKVECGPRTFYLDGAHTEQSMWACRQWFDHVSTTGAQKVLIFNSTGDRRAEVLLAPLVTFPFDLAIFCTNMTKQEDMASDNTNLNYSFAYSLKRCQVNQEMWERLQEAKAANNRDIPGRDVAVPCQVVTYIEDALNLAESQFPQKKVDIYVAGSLHLVGGVLSFIQPNCFEKTAEQILAEAQIIDEYTQLAHNNKDTKV